MTRCYSWQPSAAAAVRDRQNLGIRTGNAIRALLSEAPIEPGLRVASVLHELKREEKICHPEVFHWYFQARDRPSAQHHRLQLLKDLPALISESRQRAAEMEPQLGIAVDPQPAGAGVAQTLRDGAAYASRLAGEDVFLEPLTSWSPDIKSRLAAALSLIRRVWPEAHGEMPMVVQKFIVYRGHRVIGFTDFHYHGSIFFKYEWLMKRPHIEEVAEDLIHETAHVRLNAMMATCPMFLNGDEEIYPSPLRRDLRSMYGVFHQMYVLRRVVEWYTRLRERAVLGDVRNLRNNYDGFMQAYRVVKQHAHLTQAGRMLVRDIHLSGTLN